MAPTAVPTSSFALRSILEREKLNGTNFADWSRNLRIVIRQDKKEHILEEPIPDVPADTAAATLKSAYKKACDESLDVSCLMLAAMNSDLQKQFENIEAYDMIVALKGKHETANIKGLITCLFIGVFKSSNKFCGLVPQPKNC